MASICPPFEIDRENREASLTMTMERAPVLRRISSRMQSFATPYRPNARFRNSALLSG